jgi:UDPglucose--hexose-1-phosphate uridylyltransferase
VHKRTDRLADGRELIYFAATEQGLPADPLPDPRDLPPRPPTPQLRQDPLTGEWIAIATARQDRALLPTLDPLAVQSEGNASEVPSPYEVVVFENRSPSFGPGLSEAGLLGRDGIGIGRATEAVGRCEVVVFSQAPEGAFGSLDVGRARTVIEAWTDRTAALSALPGVAQVFVFENRGEAIGVTLRHPHGQIYAYPYVTPRTSRLLASIDAYGAGLLADILAAEQAGERVVLQGEHWTAFVPFAARWPIEVHLMPHRHVPDFTGLTEEERDELAHVYLRLLRGVDGLYGDPTPYIAAWHQAPVHTHRDEVRMMLQLTSPRRGEAKMKFLAGSEAAMGAWIGDVAPEAQAERLRAAVAAATVQG